MVFHCGYVSAEGWGAQVGPGWKEMAAPASWNLGCQRPPSQDPYGDAEEDVSGRADCGYGHGSDMFSWPTVDNSENITLMNLRPVTAYIVKVQLSRPGDGGEGNQGPKAVMVTECLGEPPSP